MWGDTFVEEGNLTQYISHLRKALDDSSEDATRLIATIARKGYQFTGDVTVSKRQTVTKEAAIQAPATESWGAGAQPVLELAIKETVPGPS